MKHLLLFLLGGSMAFLVDSNRHSDPRAQALDRVVGGNDKNQTENSETVNSSSPTPQPPLIETRKVTTTLISVIYHTSTVLDTVVFTNHDVTTKFVTSTVTREKVDVATVTNYVTSTKIAKGFLPENDKRTEHVMGRRTRPITPTATTTQRACRTNRENIGVLPKRAVTSYVYDIVSVFETRSSVTTDTRTVVSEVKSISTQFSTITSTLFKDAKSTTTVVSTVIVTSTQAVVSIQAVTSTPEPSTTTSLTESTTTETPSTTVVETTTTMDATSSESSEAATSSTATDSGSTSSQSVATEALTTSSTSASSSSESSAAAPTSSDISPGSSGERADLSTEAKAGIGAGAGAGSLALLGAVAFFALRRRRRAASILSHNDSQDPIAPGAGADSTPPPPPTRYSHLDGRNVSYKERAETLARSMEHMDQPAPTPTAQDYDQSGSFSPISLGASPVTPAEIMGYEDRRAGAHQGNNTMENTGWNMDQYTRHHEIPPFPHPSHSQYPRRAHGW
ncbi:hypothetical protein NUW58_g3347 [Xylaria curta]|uniref:Uncharacterized protein n=1 Tax=Xylaria curta TaxID=42375 RepID=A0ACC1PBG6_9PEZI|nr:hypothetical protein NUW58_g3347 [Xylaria curta]